MGFHSDHIATFLTLFETHKSTIRAFKGCAHLELYRDLTDPSLFFTYSFWDSAAALENYRQSEVFKTVWAQTKPLFNLKPEAWSLDKVAAVN